LVERVVSDQPECPGGVGEGRPDELPEGAGVGAGVGAGAGAGAGAGVGVVTGVVLPDDFFDLLLLLFFDLDFVELLELLELEADEASFWRYLASLSSCAACVGSLARIAFASCSTSFAELLQSCLVYCELPDGFAASFVS
jgi:hypothetical protein